MNNKQKILTLIKLHFPEFDTPSYNIQLDVKEKLIKVEKRELGKLLPKTLFSNFINKKYFNQPNSSYLYHYLPAKYVSNILTENKIRLYNLAKYVKNKNDPKEYSYFIDRIGLIIPNAEKYISSVINDIFILSCTSEEDSINHWDYYGQEEGACIKFKVDIKKSDYDVGIKNVVYESELTKLFCLQQCIKEQFDYSLDISTSYFFSKYVKRSYYEWEKEVRICFDNNSHQIGKKLKSYLTNGKITTSENDKYFEIKEDEIHAKYIEVPMNNDFFNLTIESIQTSSNKVYLEIEKLCNENEVKFIK
jgi:hypothetical protein